MAITSKKQGKSGGARIITFVKVTQETVYLLAVYDKSKKNRTAEQPAAEPVLKPFTVAYSSARPA